MKTQDTGLAKKAKSIAKMITDKKKEVNSATVVLSDSTAYVGIDLSAKEGKDKAQMVKNDIGKMVKEQDKSVKTVYVTEDADTVTRLKNIARDIETGKPISGFVDELRNAFSRITPATE